MQKTRLRTCPTLLPEKHAGVDGGLREPEVGKIEDWANLLKPGSNGMLSVLACLRWWRVRGIDLGNDHGDFEEWTKAVEGVASVLVCLQAHAGNISDLPAPVGNKRKSASNGTTPQVTKR